MTTSSRRSEDRVTLETVRKLRIQLAAALRENPEHLEEIKARILAELARQGQKGTNGNGNGGAA